MKINQFILAFVAIAMSACHKNPSQTQTDPLPQSDQQNSSPAAIYAPVFTVLYQDKSLVTMTVPPKTSDEEVSNLIWLLRDAAHSRSLASIGISETLVESRDPIVTFEIYRNAKCAPEHYGKGKRPCGEADHDSAFYMFGNFADRDGDGATIFDGPNETEGIQLWVVNTPYEPKSYIHPSAAMNSEQGKGAIGTWGSDMQRRIAADFSSQVWNGGLHADFSTTPKAGELEISADWLASEDEQQHIKFLLKSHIREECSAGFRSVRVTSLPPHPDSGFSLQCP